MNKVFYIVFTLFFLLPILFLFISNEEEVIGKNIDPNIVEIKDDVITKTVNSKGEYKIEKTELVSVNVKSNELDDTCIINNGEQIGVGCLKYRYLAKMDLSRYSNLKLFQNIGIANKNEIDITGHTIFKIGESDQGAVYVLIYFDDFFENSERSYFLNSVFEYPSVVFVDSDLKVEKDSPDGPEIVNIGEHVSFYKRLESWEVNKCLYSKIHEVYLENNFDVSEFVDCAVVGEVTFDEAAIEVTGISNRCEFNGGSNRYNVYTPDKVLAVSCKNISDIHINEIKKFNNINELEIKDSNVDLKFLDEYSRLESLLVSNVDKVDFNSIKRLSTLKKLYIENSGIINVSADGIYFQLHSLSFMKSNIEKLDFLKDQFSLVELNLSYLDFLQMPKIGSDLSLLTLNLKRTGINTIEGFEKFSNLEELDISYNDIKFMSNLPVNNGVFKSIKAKGNPLDCSDPDLVYSDKVISSCNLKLKQ